VVQSGESQINPDELDGPDELRAALIRLAGPGRAVRSVARRTGLSTSSISELYRGRRRVTRNSLEAFLSAYAPPDPDRWRAALARIDSVGPTALPSRVARELPAALSGLAGRAEALADLDAHVERYNEVGGAHVIAIVGMAGVGKTALALYWGHRHQADFPDGSFFLDLRGYAQSAPMQPAEALAAMLRKLGVDDVDQPADEEERAALYRTVLSTRQALVVLDNAAHAEHVRLLAPGRTKSLVVITARDSLRSTQDLQQVLRVELRPLSDEASRQLLRDLVDGGSTPAATVRAVAGYCGNLPLALRIVAGRAAERNGGMEAIVGELADREVRLDLLDSGDSRVAIRSVLSWSFQHLDDDVYRAFRMLGTGLTDDADHYVVAALAGCPAEVGRRHIRTLLQARLLQERRPGRFAMHNLLHDFARDRAEKLDPPGARLAALERLRAYYLHGAYRVRRQVGPASSDPLPSALDAPDLPEIADAAAAEAWFAAEQSGILAMVAEAAAGAEHQWVCRIADAVWWQLFSAGKHATAIWLHETAVRSAQAWERADWAARALDHLGIAEQLMGRYPDALRHAEGAVEQSRVAGDRALEARALSALGAAYARLGKYAASVDSLRRALDVAKQVGDERLQARVWNNLGLVYQRWGRFHEALPPLNRGIDVAERLAEENLLAVGLNNRSLVLRRLGSRDAARRDVVRAQELATAVGDESLLREVLDSLGSLLLESAQPADALEPLGEALRLHRAAGDRAAEAETLDNLGAARRELGDLRTAADHHEAAIRIAGEIGDAGRHLNALLGIATTYRLLGERDLAAARFDAAVPISRELKNADQEARALEGLARLRLDEGRGAEARRLFDAALVLYDGLGLPEAEVVRRLISSLPQR
jgi:tetratricopeptide (TPR) repeat protein